MKNMWTLLKLYDRFSEAGDRNSGSKQNDEDHDLVEKNSRKLDKLEQSLDKVRERRRTRERLIQTELEVLKERTRRLEIENTQLTKGPQAAEKLERDETTYRESLLHAEIEMLRERSRRIPHTADEVTVKAKNKILDEIHNAEVDLYREKVKQLEEIHRGRKTALAPSSHPAPQTTHATPPQQVAATNESVRFTSSTYTTYEPGRIPTTMRQPEPIIVRPLQSQVPSQPVQPTINPQIAQPPATAAQTPAIPTPSPVATSKLAQVAQPEAQKVEVLEEDLALGGIVSAEARAAITNISKTMETELSDLKGEIGAIKGVSSSSDLAAGAIVNPFAKDKGKKAKSATGTPDLTEMELLNASKAKQNKLFQTSSFFISPDSTIDTSQKEEWAQFKLRNLKKEITDLRRWKEKATDATKDVISNANRNRIPALTIKKFEEENKRNISALATAVDKLDKDFQAANALVAKKDRASMRKLIESLQPLYADLVEARVKRASVQDTAEELLVVDKTLYGNNIGKRLSDTQEKNKEIINLILYYIKQVAPVLEEARITEEERKMISEGSPISAELEHKASQLSELTFTWNNIKRKFNLAQTTLKNVAEDYEQKRYLKARNGLSRYDILTEEFRDEYQWNALSNNLEALGVKKITKVHQKKAVWLVIIIAVALLIAGVITVGALHLENIVLPG